MYTWLRGLLVPPAPSSESQQHRSQNPSHTYAGNRLTVRNPTRSYSATASSLAAVTVRLAERQPASRRVISDRRSSACPMPVPRTGGVTQIWVMWPHPAATRLAREMPHNRPFTASSAT